MKPPAPLPTDEGQTFQINKPDELGEFSAKLYETLKALEASKEGKVVPFNSLGQAKRVTNDIAGLCEDGKGFYVLFTDPVPGVPYHRRMYLRHSEEQPSETT